MSNTVSSLKSPRREKYVFFGIIFFEVKLDLAISLYEVPVRNHLLDDVTTERGTLIQLKLFLKEHTSLRWEKTMKDLTVLNIQ